MSGPARRIRTLIVDDEPLARASLRVLLAADLEIELVGECGSGPDAVAAIATRAPELVFLDVQMPRMTGFEVLAAIGDARRFVVVFVTAYDTYALEAFEVQALDYVLKPFDDRRFYRAVDRAKSQVRQTRSDPLAHAMAGVPGDWPAPTEPIEYLVIRDGACTVRIPIADIDWIEAADYYVQLHVAAKSYLHREPMRDLEARLDPRRFMRIHRSTIVALDRIRELRPSARGDHRVVLRDGTELKLSRSRRRPLRDRLELPAPV